MSLSAKILKAMSVFSGVQMTGMLCSMVRVKLISLWIGPAGVGLFAIFNQALEMASQTVQFNIRQSSVRNLSAASAADRGAVIASVRWWCRHLGLLGAVVMLVASPWLSLFSFGTTQWWWGFAALSVAVWCQVYLAGEQAVFQGLRQLKPLAHSSMWAVVVATLIAAPMYYYMGIDSVVPTILLFPLCGALAAVALRADPKPRVRQAARQSIAIGKDYMRLGLVMSVSTVVTSSASYIFLSYLNNEASATVTGCYQAGYTILYQYVGVIFSALGMEFYPRLARMLHSPRRMSMAVSHEMSLILCVLTPMVVVFEASADLVVRLLYSSAFVSTVPYITIGIGGAVLRAISYCMSFVIVARGDGKTYIFTEVGSAIIYLVLNVLMYKWWGLSGLGVAYILWFAAYTLLTGIAYARYRLTLSRKAVVIAVASIAIAALAILLRAQGWWQPLLALPLVPLLLLYARRPKTAPKKKP